MERAVVAVPSPNLQGSTLVLPVVAVGNVAQLAVDLIVNTLQLQRSARLQDPSLLPAVGCKPYDHVPGLATSLELYQPASGSGGGVALVQQRAPAAPGTQPAFAERLAAFVKQAGVAEVGGAGLAWGVSQPRAGK
jgi:proteasome assembly chaperone 2